MGVATAPRPAFPWQPAQFSLYRVAASRIESGRGTSGPGAGLPGKLSHPLTKARTSARAATLRGRLIPLLFPNVPTTQVRDARAAALRAYASRDRTSRPQVQQRVRTQLAKPRTTTSSRANRKTD